jgi:hypothetical protein
MRYEATWIFGAICPERDTGVALVLPEATVPAMQALIDELASHLPADRHAVLVMDRAGWHIAHKLHWLDTSTPLHLPPYSPELNPIESVWLYVRERLLTHHIFDTYNAIMDACCEASHGPEPISGFRRGLRAQPQVTIVRLAGLARRGGAKFVAVVDMAFGAAGRAELAQCEALMGIIPGVEPHNI